MEDSDRIKIRSKFISDNKKLVEWLQTNRDTNSFLSSVYTKIIRCELPLSHAQLQGIKNSMGYMLKKIEKEKVRVELEKVHVNDEPKGSYVGTLRTRYDMTLKFVSTKNTSRGFYIHNFTDREGNSLMCFSDVQQLRIDHDFVKGPDSGLHILSHDDCFTCRATVNRHSINDYDPSNKFKQTVLNRIKYNKYLGNKRLLEEGNL